MMVLSSFSPLFILWALRGNKEVSDLYLIPICALFVIIPNLFLWQRITVAKKKMTNVQLKLVQQTIIRIIF
jgi:hypothetical protein